MGEIKTGTSANGKDWQNMEIVIDVPGYQGSIDKMVLRAGTNKVNDVKVYKVGDKVEIGWTINCRQWQERWFTNLELFSIKFQGREENAAPAPQSFSNIPPQDLEPKDDDFPW